MRAVITQLNSIDIRVAAIAAWRWWVAELAPLLPNAVVNVLRARKARIFLDIFDGEACICRRLGESEEEYFRIPVGDIGVDTPSMVDGLMPRLGSAILRLPAEAVLRRRIALPYAARQKSREIVAFEFERHCPLESDHVFGDYVIINKDKAANKLGVELRMVTRDMVANALTVARALGLEIREIAFRGDPHFANNRVFLPDRSQARKSIQIQHVLTWSPAVLALVMGIAVLIASIVRDNRDLAILTSQVEAARGEAHTVESIRRDVEKAKLKAQFLPRQKESLLVSQILNEVTRVLPDGTWLFQFEISGKEVRLHGYSPAASTLIALFDESPLFTGTRFRAPLTQGPRSDLERFDLSTEVKEKGR